MRNSTTKMMRFLVLLCIATVISAQRSKIHEEMTKDEIIYHFGPDNDEVPDYEVVQIAHGRNPKSAEHRVLELTSFSRDIRLYLEPTDGYLAGTNTPVFRAKYNPKMTNEVQFDHIPGAMKGNHKLYQDPLNNAAVVIKYDPMGFPLINGIINLLNEKHSLVIRPLLSRFQHKFQRLYKREVSEFNSSEENSDLEYTHHHVVYKLPNKKQSTEDDYEYSDDDYDNNEIGEVDDDDEKESVRNYGDEGHGHVDLVAFSHGKRKRWQGNNRVPEIVYPQILVIVESSFFRLFKRDVNAVIEYLLAFWNGVDLRYRAYQMPSIRLNIAGIIISEDPSMTPYIRDNRVLIKEIQNNKINVTSALRSKAVFMYPETFFNETDQTLTMKRLGFKFDIAITMTTMDMCQLPSYCADEKTKEYTCDIRGIRSYCDTLGFAYYTGGCAFDGDEKEMEGVGIIEDSGSFFGIIPTAHEIGHLLGASHDAHNKHKCDVDDGYLMSYQMNVKQESFIWSNCSAESVKFFLRKEKRAQCLFDKPNTGKNVPRKLPGKMLSRDEVCHRTSGTYSCPSKWYREQCDVLYCANKNVTKEDPCHDVRNHAVPEGASCGIGFHCLNGKCVSMRAHQIHLELGTTTPEPQIKQRYLPSQDDTDDY